MKQNGKKKTKSKERDSCLLLTMTLIPEEHSVSYRHAVKFLPKSEKLPLLTDM